MRPVAVYTDGTATCMVVNEDIFVMLLTEEKFQTFTPKQNCDAGKYIEVLVWLSLESRSKSRSNGCEGGR
jgi:predicted lactoylglutathione lyase